MSEWAIDSVVITHEKIRAARADHFIKKPWRGMKS
jgi:hypothetical protein